MRCTDIAQPMQSTIAPHSEGHCIYSATYAWFNKADVIIFLICIDVSSSPSDHENIASQEVQFIGDESISHTDVPLPKDVRYVNLNANEEYDYIRSEEHTSELQSLY